MALFARLLLILAGVPLIAIGQPPLPPRDPFADISPMPALVDFCQSRQIPLGVDRDARRDIVVLLVTLYEGASSRQWLACLEEDSLTEQERLAGSPADQVRYTTAGSTYRFPQTLRALRVSFAGPFIAGTVSPGVVAPGRVDEQRQRVFVAKEYLERGFVAFSRSALSLRERIHAAGLKNGTYWIGNHPFPADVVAAGRQQARAIQMTAEDERRTCEVLFSLQGFYEATAQVPALAAVLAEVLEKPSLWSVVRHAGIHAKITLPWDGEGLLVRDAHAGEPALFQIPVEIGLNGKPALRAWLGVGEPAPPFDLCAGILGIYAEHPADKGKRLYVRVIGSGSARSARTLP